MEASLRVFGDEYLDTLTNINNLAFTLKARGRCFTNGKMLPTAESRPRPSASIYNIITRSFEWLAVKERGDRRLKEFHLLYA